MSKWQVTMLGTLSVQRGSVVVTRFTTQPTASLLAYLAYQPTAWHPREVLIEMLWPGVAAERGRGRLNTALHSLRRILECTEDDRGRIVLADREHVRLAEGQVTTDVQRFTAMVRDNPSGAVDLWSGPFLEGFYQDWVAPAREALTDTLLGAARRAVAEGVARGEHGAALAAARRAVQADPLREEGHLLVIRSALAAGARDLAHRQYKTMADALERELGICPSIAFEELCSGQGQGSGVLGVEAQGCVAQTVRLGGQATATVLACVGHSRRSVADVVQGYRGAIDWGHDGQMTALFGTALDAFGCAVDLAEEQLAVALHTTEAGDLHQARSRGRALAQATKAGTVLTTEAAAALLRQEASDRARVEIIGYYEVLPGRGAEPVYHVSPAASPRREAPTPALPREVKGSLPSTLSRFFGRESELAELLSALRQPHSSVMTITGPGGSGKSRIAIELGRTWMRDQGTPAWFVPLASLSSTPEISRRAAEVVLNTAVPPGDATERLVLELRRLPGLLILDNLEHLPETAAGLVAQLRTRVPDLRCVLTSRHCLGFDGEVEYPLSPLPWACASNDVADLLASTAVALFVDRARAALPTFTVTPRNAAAVAGICARMEGLPLALELAAARIRTMTPSTMLANIAERLDWVANRRDGLPDRHQTLRATLAWSLGLLPDALRRFLCRLGVLQGSFDADCASEVAEEPLAAEYLAQLRAFSLVVREADECAVRWRLLAMVREFVVAQLDSDALARTRERHARSFFARAASASVVAGAGAGGAGPMVSPIAGEMDDLRAAVGWGQRHDPAATLTALMQSSPAWHERGLWHELGEWLDKVIPLVPQGHPLVGHALLALSDVAAQSWRQPAAKSVAHRAADKLRADGDMAGLLQALWTSAVIASQMGDRDALASCVSEGAALAEQLGVPQARILALDLVALRSFGTSAWRDGVASCAEACEASRHLDDQRLLAVHIVLMVGYCFYLGDTEAAEKYMAMAADVDQLSGRDSWASFYRLNAAVIRMRQGRVAEAAELLAAGSELWCAAPTHQTATAMVALAYVQERLGRRDDAVGWLRRAVMICEQLEITVSGAGFNDFITELDRSCRQVLTASQVRQATRRGEQHTLADLSEALAELPRQVAAVAGQTR